MRFESSQGPQIFTRYLRGNIHHWLCSSFRVVQFLPFLKGTLKNIISFVQLPINRYSPEVHREDGNTWQADSTVDISWDSISIRGLDKEVSTDLARCKMGHDDVPRTGQLPRSSKQST